MSDRDIPRRKRVIVLGATGSIGASGLDIIRNDPGRFEVVGLSAHRNREALASLAREFGVSEPILSSEGEAPLLEMVKRTEADVVLNGIAGSSGLRPSIAALESGKDLALANKETIVMAGPLIRDLAKRAQARILPVDSEHSAVFALIEAHGSDAVAEVVLTASGGPFRSWDRERLARVRAADALRHPTWSMGPKITVDSASLANKGLEVIEACRLFDLPPDRVKVVVHPQSLVHSLIRTKDGVLWAQISLPDMRHPILSALAWPEVVPNQLEPLALDRLLDMRFEPPRYDDFPLLPLARRAAGMGGAYTIAYNASNEEAVAAFLEDRIGFLELAEVTARVLERDWSGEPADFDAVFAADAAARKAARDTIAILAR